MNAPATPFSAELSASMQWWRDAGVDCDFTDDATDWLAEKEVKTAQNAKKTSQSGQKSNNSEHSASPDQAPQKTIERVNLLGDSPPATLEEFHKWWLETPGLDSIGPRGRIAPRGTANPKLMVLVIDPEEADRTRLLSGPQGRLLSQILAAMGFEESDVYFASALPRHTPLADTGSIAASGMDSVVEHHIKLVSPQKILAFGSGILPLLGQSVTNSEKSLREINQNSRNRSQLVGEALDSLMSMPRLKARFWRRWIEWSSE